MFIRLEKLKNIGYTPSTILDIGAYKGDWTKDMLKIYPDSKYYLIEANDHRAIDSLANIRNIHIYKNTILNDKIQEVDWYQNHKTGDSMFKENTQFYKDTTPTKKTSIDLNSFLTNNNIDMSKEDIFIKIDCQGAEIPILKGSSTILNNTSFILIELPLFGNYNSNVPNFLEHIQFMDDIGFIPYDLTNILYLKEFAVQLDMLFINKKHKLNEIVQEKIQNITKKII
jgi:FkbM family methyltransferase